MADRITIKQYRKALERWRQLAECRLAEAIAGVERILNREIEQGRLSTDAAARCKALVNGAARRALEQAAEQARTYAEEKRDDH